MGCGIPIGLVVLAVIGFAVWIGGKEGGVRLSNNLEQYSLDYINEHKLVEPDEEILAYYDVTVSLSAKEGYILTDQRVISYVDTTVHEMALSEIDSVDHRNETLIGDIIEVYDAAGHAMVLEIAPWMNGESFYKLLQKRVDMLQPAP